MYCDFCKKNYASKYSFRNHVKTNKHIEKKENAQKKLELLAAEIKLEVEETEHLNNLLLKYLLAEKILDKFIEYDAT